jgi:hypothetical protein
MSDLEEIIAQSHDGREIKNAAIALAASQSPEDHALLLNFLSSEDFLRKLDAPESYEGVYTDLRLGRVIDALVGNRVPSSDRVLLELIKSLGYQAHVLRIQILLRALVVVRPSPPAAIAYWDRLSNPESPILQDVIEALCENQSPPAMDLLERKFADPAQKPTKKIRWMQTSILVRRNDVPILICCERMVTKSLPPEGRPSLVEVLFDYRPHEWYMPEAPPEPPPREKASETARNLLRRIGDFALKNVDLTPTQEAAVKNTLDSLGHA